MGPGLAAARQTGMTTLKVRRAAVLARTSLQRHGRVVRLRLVNAILDRRAVDHVELAAFDLGDVLVAEGLVDLAVEDLVALRVLLALLEGGHRLRRLDQRL